jgi:undecaprenyl-diphosphatase
LDADVKSFKTPMLESIKAIDTQLFLFLNGLHFPVLDKIMWLASDRFFWIPLYLWLLWLLYRSQKKYFWVVLISILILILASDQLCNLFKFGVMRLRPSNEPSLASKIHLLNGYSGGSYGFYSAHASNSFALSIFVIMLSGKKFRFIIPVLLGYALLVSYSRIYLGVHYPSDVFTGIIFGILIGLITAKLYFRYSGFLEERNSRRAIRKEQ